MINIRTRIYTDREPNKNMVSILLYFPAGGKNDPENTQGLSHFLEHIISTLDINMTMEIKYKGGERILQTFHDYIRINHYVPKNFWKQNLINMMDYIFKSQITQEKVEKEKKHIINEINHWQSFPNYRVYKELQYTMFYPHPYSNNSSGTCKHFCLITPEFLEYYRSCFWNDITIVVCGAINEDNVINTVNNYIEKLNIKENKWKSEKRVIPEEKHVYKNILFEKCKNYLGVGYLIKKPTTDDLSVFYLLLNLLWFQDPLIKEIFSNHNFTIINFHPNMRVYIEELLYFSLVMQLTKTTKSDDLLNMWEEFAEKSVYFIDKAMLLNEIQDFRSKSIITGDYYFVKKDFRKVMKNIKNLNKDKIIYTFMKINRTVIIHPEG